jgi:S-adenosylmethionine hydrolase
VTVSLLTLTTDFGDDSSYVAAMKGVLFSINPGIRFLDLSHNIPPQDLRYTAYFLAGCVPFFPAGTLHVIVVDPGVGTDRALLHVEAGGQQLLVPDNGCWTLAAAILDPPLQVRQLTEPRFWRRPVSATFHGRDILAPVAAHLTLGVRADQLGPVASDWVSFDPPQPTITPTRISGEVVVVDPFGNLLSNIPGEAFRALGTCRVHIGSCEVERIVRSYGEAPPGTVVALISSSGVLEIACAQGSAARALGVGVGTPVEVVAGTMSS